MKKGVKAFLFVVLASMIGCPCAYAGPVVVKSEGKYVMGDCDSKRDAKNLALMEAKRLAMEKAGTYLESTSEVQNYELTKDEVMSLAAGVMSVEVLKEEWKLSGESLMLTVQIVATIDASNLQKHIDDLKENHDSVKEFKTMQAQIAALQRQLDTLKTERSAATAEVRDNYRQKHEAIMKELSALEYLEKGAAELREKNWDGAVASYSRAIDKNPKLQEAYIGRATALRKKGHLREALTTVDTALQIAPASSRARAVKSSVLYNMKKYRKALVYINEAIQDDNKDPKFFRLRAEINLKLRKLPAAAKDYDTACSMGSKRACMKAKELARKAKKKARNQ